jgi:hypothetical protein
MRRLLVAMMAATLTAAAGTVIANAGSPENFVVGGGQHLAFGTGPGIVNFGVEARSAPDGSDVSGELTFISQGEGPAFHAKVTCLIVAGKDAIATGVFTSPETSEGQTVVMEAVDGGKGSTRQGPDKIRFSFANAINSVPGKPGCFTPQLPPVEVINGNISVNQAT